ncbi:hypothetical protein BVRB_4g071220 isoform A [Beta vulgaris subsp. vulgaris]|nr:hypothetical protein BVRB_4g071220 isoform A [Beta vulgaris subsp. vulgaris]
MSIFAPIAFLHLQRSHLSKEYAKPRRLLPTKELSTFRDESPDKFISTLQTDRSNSLYKVLLRTSSMYGSDLSDQNAGILVCLIDEHGDSILERIPAILCQDHFQQSEDAVTSDVVRFQKGSTDEFIFWGPKLGRIQALWISLDSGSWRLGGANLTVTSAYDHQREESSTPQSMYCSVIYNFEVEDVMLGEGTDLTMAELRPCLVTEHIGADYVSFFYESSAQDVSRAEKGLTNEDSMRSYADLKFSLLLYDSMLVFAGTSITSISAGQDTALAFLTGGIGGFMYLLLLQRSVDTLPAPELAATSKGNNFNRLFGGVKGPIVVFVFAVSIAVLAMKHDKPDFGAALTSREIVAGMVGFLACKVSVVLAAFKPVSMGMEDND